MPTSTDALTPGETLKKFFIPTGVPIERCPLCGQRVVRLNEKTDAAPFVKWRVIECPDVYEFGATFGEEHPCPGVLFELQAGAVFFQTDAETKEANRLARLAQRGLSPCCEAPIVESQAETRVARKGHGPRFCSKCRKCLFWV